MEGSLDAYISSCLDAVMGVYRVGEVASGSQYFRSKAWNWER